MLIIFLSGQYSMLSVNCGWPELSVCVKEERIRAITCKTGFAQCRQAVFLNSPFYLPVPAGFRV